jgi:putative ABC transport system ATP-binding protein
MDACEAFGGSIEEPGQRFRRSSERSSSSDGAIVSCAELRRRFGEGQAAVDALRGVTVEFPRGELTGIVGPSGSGKSTLMHLLAGLDRPTAGKVWIAGTEITGLDDAGLTQLRRDKLGFVFQFFNLVPVLTADENIALPVRIAGDHVDSAWLDSLLETVGLTDRRTHRPSELSGGQQQRVAIARALMTRPAVVFADEPTGNLDSKSGDDVLDLLRKSVDEFQQTVVMVTHDPRVASYADRVLVLADGQIIRDARVQSQDEVLELMKAV